MEYTTLGNFLVVDIHTPLNSYPNYEYCRVRKEYFEKAKTMGKYVLVRTPKGERVFMPKAMKGQKIVKEVFLSPDNPMKLYELCIPVGIKKPDEYWQFVS